MDKEKTRELIKAYEILMPEIPDRWKKLAQENLRKLKEIK